MVLTGEHVSCLKWTGAGVPGQKESVLNLAVGVISKSSVNVMTQCLGVKVNPVLDLKRQL